MGISLNWRTGPREYRGFRHEVLEVSLRPLPSQPLRSRLRQHRVDQHAGGVFPAGRRDQAGENLDSPTIVRMIHVERRRADHDVQVGGFEAVVDANQQFMQRVGQFIA